MASAVLDSDSHSEVIKETKIDYDPLISKVTSKTDQIVVLDVGGRKFDVLVSTFSTWPESRLVRISIKINNE